MLRGSLAILFLISSLILNSQVDTNAHCDQTPMTDCIKEELSNLGLIQW